MADDLKIPFDQLKKTNDDFNSYMKAKKDPEFDCMIFDNAVPNEEGPFLAVRLWPRVHHCMGGLEINNKAEVLSCRGEPIKGLYAAGEVTGGVHGMVRLGTVAVADCMIFGRCAHCARVQGLLIRFLRALRRPCVLISFAAAQKPLRSLSDAGTERIL